MKDALWLLGSALTALAICAGTMTGILYLERPAPAVQPVQQACVTTTAARG